MSDTAKDQALAQVSSIYEMVAALYVDYDRLEELQEKKEAGHWVAGWNMPGYMPDSEPAAFDTDEEASVYLSVAMQDEADYCADQGAMEWSDSLKKSADHLQSDEHSGEYGATVGRFHYWITQKPGELSDPDEQKELTELEEAAGDCESEDDARQRIEEDALSVEIRSDWCAPGEEMTAGEFRILLCTGGPHVELVGDLDDNLQPSRVRVIYKDWGESGELFDFDRDAVLRYCSVFYFGE